jgi:Ca2+-binding RTX toxin-like protein
MSFHHFRINEVYSDSSGRIQYIEFVGTSNSQHLWDGNELISSSGPSENTYDFTKDLSSSITSGKSVLVATQGYADLGLAKPDFVVPNDFLFLPDGSVNFPGMDQGLIEYTNLPNDGVTALNLLGDEVVNSPRNFSGVNGKIPGTPVLGGDNIDTLTGSDGKDFMVSLGGNDTMDGGTGNDTLRGGTGNDSLLGGDGNDVLDGGGGSADVVEGGAGNDKLAFGGTTETHNGGADTDTLLLLVNLNLITTDNARIVDVERIDMGGGGIDTLIVSKSEVLAISSSTDMLTVVGNSGDRVNLPAAFTLQSTAGGFETWQAGLAIIKIETELNVI